MNVQNVTTELRRVLKDRDTIIRMKRDYADLKKLLSEGGNASEKAAKSIVQMIRRPHDIKI